MRNTTNRNDQLVALYSRLLAERRRMKSERRGDLEVLVAHDNAAVEDRIPILHEQFVVLSNLRTHRERFAVINVALARYERGEFGICEECDEPIPLKRLHAIPWAACCISCQERVDNNATYGEPELALIA